MRENNFILDIKGKEIEVQKVVIKTDLGELSRDLCNHQEIVGTGILLFY